MYSRVVISLIQVVSYLLKDPLVFFFIPASADECDSQAKQQTTSNNQTYFLIVLGYGYDAYASQEHDDEKGEKYNRHSPTQGI